MSKDIKFIIGKLKEGLEQEKDIVEVVKEKQCATYEVETGKYKGNIKIQKANNCWLCEEIKKGCYRMENSNKTLKLEMYKEQNSGDYIIQANGEDVLQQEINYCPICRKKIRGGKPMLRIKEEIDLKELKKFGFKKTKKYYELLHVWYPLGDSVPCYKTSINVRIDNRHIYTYIEELTWQGQKDYHSFDFQDVIYDLIKADMVEKI